MGGQPKSEASSLSFAEGRRLWEEPTEAIPQNQREALGILSLQGEEDVKADFPLSSSMQGIQHATSRETGRRDLRRPSGHPAPLRLPAKSGTRGSLTTQPDAALPDS